MPDEWVEVTADEDFIRRERAKARELRKTPYYQNLFNRGICHYCGKKFPREELTLDHIVPVARGGRSTRGNRHYSHPTDHLHGHRREPIHPRHRQP